MGRTHIQKEKDTVRLMIRLYCKKTHKGTDKNGNKLCPECQVLLEYAYNRLDKCRFGENKCSCLRCPAQCYKPDMRENIRAVMRYIGPRMPYLAPIAYVRYFIR